MLGVLPYLLPDPTEGCLCEVLGEEASSAAACTLRDPWEDEAASDLPAPFLPLPLPLVLFLADFLEEALTVFLVPFSLFPLPPFPLPLAFFLSDL